MSQAHGFKRGLGPESPDSASDTKLEARHSLVRPAASSWIPPQIALAPTVSEALVDALVGLGVEQAYGIFGGGIAPFCRAVSESPIRLLHFRHEAGAAFAAIESSLASGRPTVVIATTGPGVSNLYTGMAAARAEGAKVLFISGTTPSAQRGRGAFQETGGAFSTLSPLFVSGNLFHHAGVIDDPTELETTLSRLVSGFARPQGFVAHLGLPLAVQTARRAVSMPRVNTVAPGACDPQVSAECAELLAREPFVIWAGFGARGAAGLVQALSELSGAPVMCTPRAKGVMPETHPLYLGVTGLGGHVRVIEHLRRARPTRALVLGSRLGEMSSFWLPELAPSDGFIHVDLEADAFGAAYPEVSTIGVQAEIGTFLRDLIRAWPEKSEPRATFALVPSPELPLTARAETAVRPSYLMQQIQREIVEQSSAIVMTEAGNSFSLGSQKLNFPDPGRYRLPVSAVTCVGGSAGRPGLDPAQRHRAADRSISHHARTDFALQRSAERALPDRIWCAAGLSRRRWDRVGRRLSPGRRA